MAYKQKAFSGFTKKNKLKKMEQNLDDLKQNYASLPTDNVYNNMDNPYEDVLINLKQMENDANEYKQNQAQILGTLRESSGSSGPGTLVQALARENSIASSEMVLNIGKQEEEGNKKNLEFQAMINDKKAEGETLAYKQNLDKQSTLLGLNQMEIANAREEIARKAESDFNLIQSGVTGVSKIIKS